MSIKPKKDFKQLLKSAESRTSSKENADKKLSLCMIVKNEEKNLDRCLKSVLGVVDEIIIVDTGSTDNTVEIAKKYDTKIYHHEWENSFAKARNIAIDYATGDWILILDADEELSISSRDKIRRFLIDIDYNLSYDLHIKNIDEYGRVLVENYMTRMFKNVPSLRYLGDIHEFIPGIETYIRINEEDIHINHYGYSDKEHSADKIKNRNIPLVAKALEGDDKRQKSGLYLYQGLSYMELQETDKAIEFFREGIKAFKAEPYSRDMNLRAYLFVGLLMIYVYKDEMDKAASVVEEAKEYTDYVGEYCDYWYFKSRVESHKNNYKQAIEDCKKSIEIYADNKSAQTTTLKNYNNYINALLALPLYYIQEKDYISAEKQVDISIKEIKLRDKFTKYVKTFASMYLEFNSVDKALDLYKNALNDCEPDEKKDLVTGLSNLYLYLGREAEAVKAQASIHNSNEVKENWYKLAENLEDQKKFNLSEEVYTEIINALPEETRAYQGRFIARLTQNKQIDALDDLALAMNYAKSEEEIMKVGQICMQVGLLTQAESCFKKILKENKNHYQANLNLANIDQHENKFDQSKKKLQELIQQNPEKIEAYIQLGNMLINTGSFDKAIELFNQAHTLEENNIYINYALAIANFEKGDRQASIKSIKQGLKIEPDNKDLLKLEEIILQKS